jgi:hypothetical protein
VTIFACPRVAGEIPFEDNRYLTLEAEAMEDTIFTVAVMAGFVVIVFGIKDLKHRLQTVRQCIHCRKEIHKKATICPYCRTTFKSDDDKLPPSL